MRALRELAILDTTPEQAFDDIAALAAQLCAAPVALVSLVDAERQWFKARIGFDACETDLERSVCRLVVQDGEPVVIPDLAADPRTARNPLVAGDPAIRFYAGAPLVTAHGHVIGALCVIDAVPRPHGLTQPQYVGLTALARRVVEALELRRIAVERLETAARQDALLAIGDALRDSTAVGDMTRRVAEIVGRLLGASRAGYGNVDAEIETVEIEPDWTADGVASIAGRHRFADFGDIREDLLAGRPLVISDVFSDPRTAADLPRWQRLGIGALVNMPVRERGQIVAVFIVQSSGERMWNQSELSFIRNVADRLEVAIGRLRAEERQALLNGEIAHRLKNSLSMVQAIANQTLRSCTDPAQLDAFGRRIHALGTAHDALLERGLQAADLRDVIERALAALGVRDRCRIEGAPVRLGARAALSTSLVMHELTTNAIKYGALSAAGEVRVGWAMSGDQLRLEWEEAGGPPAVQPTRRGFGSRLLALGLVGAGGAEISYAPEGLRVTFQAEGQQLRQA